MGSLTRRYGAEAEVVSAKSPREAAAPYVDPPVREETADGRPYNFKVTSWNVDGLRAWVRKGGLQVGGRLWGRGGMGAMGGMGALG